MIERACSLITIFAVQKYINDTNNPIAEQMINDAPEQKLKTDRLLGHFAILPLSFPFQLKFQDNTVLLYWSMTARIFFHKHKE